MKNYYSFRVTSDRDLAFRKYLVILGPGLNVFTLTTENISETVREFLEEGVKIQQVNLLSGPGVFDGLPPGVLFPGESASEQETDLCALGGQLPEAG